VTVENLVLASGSPRRALLLRTAGFTFEVRIPDVVETVHEEESALETVLRLAQLKADAIDRDASEVALAADTMVVLDGEALGKPMDRDDALGMLGKLSGGTHSVLTGWVAVGDSGERFGVTETRVTFKDLTEESIEGYVDDAKPFDKAGAYGIQGENGRLIKHVAGSRANVMGLPLREVVDALNDLGIDRSASHG
jgi:septum formation protein